MPLQPRSGASSKARQGHAAAESPPLTALPYRKAPAFIHKLRAADGVAARCLEFSMLTACRTSELLFATGSEIDIDAALWVIPKDRMQAKEEHVVHLSPRALEIPAGQRGLDPAYPFPSPMLVGRPMSDMAMLTIPDRLGERDRTTVHGLCRATFSDWCGPP